MDVEEVDINKTPPDRAFLEKHVDESRFLDFVSTRSPVWKTRPLPRSKKEAIDLMMEQPNLIRRPILIKGSKVTFGFDREGLRRAHMSRVRVGTSGWSYPTGQGTWNGIFYPTPPGRSRKRTAGFDDLSFYAEHFDTVEVNSTLLWRSDGAATKGWVERTPANFEFSLKLYQKFTHPEMFHRGDRTGSVGARHERRGWLPRGHRSDRERRKAWRAARAVSCPASRTMPNARGYLEWLLEAFTGYPLAIELRHRSFSDDPDGTLRLLSELGAALVQIDEPKFRLSIRQDAAAQREDVLLHAAARPERRAVVEAR